MLAGVLFGGALGTLSAFLILVCGGTWGLAVLSYFGVSMVCAAAGALRAWRSGEIDSAEVDREVEFVERRSSGR